jgi:hypothetical protein
VFTRFPFTSKAVTVAVDVEIPSAVIDTGDALIVDVAADGAPATKSIVCSDPPKSALSVNRATAVSTTVDEVTVAVYVPSLLSVVAE